MSKRDSLPNYRNSSSLGLGPRPLLSRARRQHTTLALLTPLATPEDHELDQKSYQVLKQYRALQNHPKKIAKVSSDGQITTETPHFLVHRKQALAIKESIAVFNEILPKNRSPRLQRKVESLTKKIRSDYPGLSNLCDTLEEYIPIQTLDFAISSQDIQTINRFESSCWNSHLLGMYLLDENGEFKTTALELSAGLLNAWLKGHTNVDCLRLNAEIVQLPQFWTRKIEGTDWIVNYYKKQVAQYTATYQKDQDNQELILHTAKRIIKHLLKHMMKWDKSLVQFFRMMDSILVLKNMEMYEEVRSVLWVIIFRIYIPEYVNSPHFTAEFLPVIKMCSTYSFRPPDSLKNIIQQTIDYLTGPDLL